MPITSRPDLLPFALPSRLIVPYHGLATNGVIALPGGKTKACTQPTGGSTVLVAGKNPPTDARTAEQIAADAAVGWQALDYAYLSGQSKLYAGIAVDPTGEGADNWAYRKSGRWLHNDGTTTWLMSWEVYDAGIGHHLRIKVIAPFGLFVAGKADTYSAYTIFDADFEDPEGPLNDYSAADPYGVIALHSKDGSKSAFTFWRRFLQQCAEVYLEIYPILRWEYNLTAEAYDAIMVDGMGYVELSLGGTGARIAATPGIGLIASVERGYFYSTTEYLRTVTPAGAFSTWTQSSGAITGVGGSAGYYSGNSGCDWRGEVDPTVGVQAIDNSYWRAWQSDGSWIALHWQGGDGCADGVSYDIANDEWSTTTNSCYV